MWHYRTHKGVFYIVPRDGQYEVIFDDDRLGSYPTPEQAADDLAGGHTYWPSAGFDPGELGISDDLGDWTFENI